MKCLTDITWYELDQMPRNDTVLFQVVAPVEEHSLHLPLGTDIMLGEIWAQRAIRELESDNPRLRCVMLPSLPIAAGAMRGFPGCLYQSPKAVRKILFRILDRLARAGFVNLVVVASHGDPFHQIAVEKACVAVNKRYGKAAISPLGAIVFSGRRPDGGPQPSPPLAAMLSERPLDFHAGWVETSMIMAERPDLVMGDVSALPDVEVAEREMIDAAGYSRKTAGLGHLGYPRLASAEFGRELIDMTARDLAAVTRLFVSKRGYEPFSHHDMWPIPFFRMLA